MPKGWEFNIIFPLNFQFLSQSNIKSFPTDVIHILEHTRKTFFLLFHRNLWNAKGEKFLSTIESGARCMASLLNPTTFEYFIYSFNSPYPARYLSLLGTCWEWVSCNRLELARLAAASIRGNDSAASRDMTTHIALWREIPWHVRIVYLSDWIFQSKWKSIFSHHSAIRRLIYILIEKSNQMLCGLWNLNNSVRPDGGLAGHWNGINGLEWIDYAMIQLARIY